MFKLVNILVLSLTVSFIAGTISNVKKDQSIKGDIDITAENSDIKASEIIKRLDLGAGYSICETKSNVSVYKSMSTGSSLDQNLYFKYSDGSVNKYAELTPTTFKFGGYGYSVKGLENDLGGTFSLSFIAGINGVKNNHLITGDVTGGVPDITEECLFLDSDASALVNSRAISYKEWRSITLDGKDYLYREVIASGQYHGYEAGVPRPGYISPKTSKSFGYKAVDSKDEGALFAFKGMNYITFKKELVNTSFE